MNVWPVLAREVRQAARQPATYRARLIAACAVLGAGMVFGFQAGGFNPGQGASVFSLLHLAVFISTWVLVPLFAADCLSRERREGTLGLLFLTPLRALDIVLAKLAVHGLGGLTIWLAAVPLFAIPILIGGVSWQQATGAVMFNLSALMLSLAAALLASAFSKNWTRSVIGSLLIAAVLIVVWFYLIGVLTAVVFWLLTGTNSVRWDFLVSDQMVAIGWECLRSWPELVSKMRWSGVAPSAAASMLLVASVAGVVVSACILSLACIGAARATRRNWQEAPQSRLRVAVERRFTTPIMGQDLLKRWLRRTLDRNPVGWLERRTWTGRLIMFGWLAIVIGVFSGLVPQIDFWRLNMRRLQVDLIDALLAQPLLLSMAAAAAGSFRRERETGVLELLLVSPLRAPTIVLGRIRGLYAQFMPSVMLVLIGWIFLLTIFPDVDPDRFNPVIRFVAWSVSIPCIGLYLSLRTRNFLTAFLLTAIAGWGGPWLVAIIYGAMSRGYKWWYAGRSVPFAFSLVPVLVVLLMAIVAVWCLIRRLDQRKGILSDYSG